MAHYKSTRPEKAPKGTTHKCAACGKKRAEKQMKREPPGNGVWICDDKTCRAEVQKRNGD